MSSVPSWDPVGQRLYAITNRGTLIGLRFDAHATAASDAR